MGLLKNKFTLGLLIICFCIGIYLGLNWSEFVEGFKEGWNGGRCDCP
ncbi:hypothetical protein BC751_4089 [Cecembia calidifontis]|jgi:hypothetical protein|uniref:Uncharacterized protein n=1 Tax=Cecembia calidifontis TaxID=1187080 RepID=A0A4Q7PDI5_9BACT|nr:hypothetical protein BC751_4089 [Cecembia calidifontis]